MSELDLLRPETTPAMRIATSRAELADALTDTTLHIDGLGRRAVVMTMGALHDGHLQLVRAAREIAEHVTVTIFVNRLQFGPGEDFDAYPRTLDADLDLLRAEGVDLVFAPSDEVMYPGGDPLVTVRAGRFGEVFEGAARPGHFDGVLTVVAKLLHLTRPDVALFGQKDAQQLALVRRMVRDLEFPVEIRAVPIARADDGLALSSRNVYLSADERDQALALSKAMAVADVAADRGAQAVRREATGVLSRVDGVHVDYLALVDPETFTEVAADHDGPALLAVAARVGTTRLLDNVPLDIRRPASSTSGFDPTSMQADESIPAQAGPTDRNPAIPVSAATQTPVAAQVPAATSEQAATPEPVATAVTADASAFAPERVTPIPGPAQVVGIAPEDRAAPEDAVFAPEPVAEPQPEPVADSVEVAGAGSMPDNGTPTSPPHEEE